MDCCKINSKNKKCIRKKDGKVFSFPRKYSKEKCLTQPIKGFTMRSSCAPFKYCSKRKEKTKKTKKTSKKKTKKQFLYNPKHPSKSMDIYNNENPEDTIPIKFTTLQDVKTTITKLEKLYKKEKYNHRRITQVAIIMRVRLKIILDKSKAKHKAQIKNRYQLAKRYSDFLKTRTPLKEQDRKSLTFNF